MRFEVTDTHVLLYRDTDTESNWGQPHTKIGDVREENGKQCSEWVLHLSSKSWCSKDDLYKFASIIRELKKDEDIDWNATFQIIERQDYLEQANRLRNYTKSNSELPILKFSQLGETIRFNADDDRSESQPVINKEVRENLIKYNLL